MQLVRCMAFEPNQYIMGYETRLYIGLLHEKMLATDPGRYVRKLAMIEIDAPIFTGTFIEEKDKEVPVYLIADGDANPDEMLADDKYGSQLYAINPQKIQAKLLIFQGLKEYPMAFAAAQFLRSLIMDYAKTRWELVCVLYGH